MSPCIGIQCDPVPPDSFVQAGDYNVKHGGNSDVSDCTHLHESIHNK